MRTIVRIISCATTLLALLAATAQVRADIIFSNFGPGDTYQDVNGPFIGGFTGITFDTGHAFTPRGSSFSLDGIELAANLISGPNELDVWLTSDAGGVPGIIIESWHLSGEMGPYPLINPALGVRSISHPVLLEDVEDLVVGLATSYTLAIWNENSICQFGAIAQRADGGPWNRFFFLEGAFRVTGTPVIVPEPSTLFLLVVGAVSTGAFGRRRGLKLI